VFNICNFKGWTIDTIQKLRGVTCDIS